MKKLKKLFKEFNIDGYIVPKNNEYFNEYIHSSEDRLKFISNFSGSAGFAVVWTEDIQFKQDINQEKNLK